MSQPIKWIISIFGLVFIALIFLTASPVQSNRFTYIWQSFIGFNVKPTPTYTGRWRTWNNRGELQADYGMVKGVYHGVAKFPLNGGKRREVIYEKGVKKSNVFYYESGQIESFVESKDGPLDGLCMGWHENGLVAHKSFFKKSMPFAYDFVYSKAGVLMGIVYWDGKGFADENRVWVYDKSKGIDSRSEHLDKIKRYEVFLQEKEDRCLEQLKGIATD